jgi:hypothetical protein
LLTTVAAFFTHKQLSPANMSSHFCSSQKSFDLTTRAAFLIQQKIINETVEILRSCLLVVVEATKTYNKCVGSNASQTPNCPFHDMPPHLNHNNHNFHGGNAYCEVACTDPAPPIKIGGATNESNNLASRVEMFNRALLTPSCFESMCTPQNQAIVAAIAFYNMGLVRHRMESNGDAQHFYTQLKKCTVWPWCRCPQKPCFPVSNDLVKEHILFAVVSIKYHIHAYFFDREEAHECRVYLGVKLPLYPHILSKEDYLFVGMDILLSDPNVLEAAAAA